MSNPVVRQIVLTWLKEHDYDGLFHSDSECGCTLDHFMICDEPNIDECEAGYSDQRKANGLGCRFWISRAKEID